MTATNGRKLRVLMVAPTSFFADYGCHVRILEETRALQSRGHEVLICTYHNGNDVEGIPTHRTIDIPWRKRVVVGSSRHKLYLDAMLSFEVLRAIRRFKPDLIHAHLHEGALIGGVAGMMTRTPVVFDYQGSLTEEMLDHGFMRHGGKREWFMRRLERAIEWFPHLVITSSDNARTRLAKSGFDEKRIATVFDAVDTTRFSPNALTIEERAALRQIIGIRPDQPVVGYLGLLAPYQGSDLLLEAANRIVDACPETFFLIMGFPGNELYYREASQRGLSDNTSFPGRISYREAHRYLALADIAVAPKMSLTEGNGKLYNYMAMGLPVVAFDAPANREVLGDHGIYAEHGNTAELTEKLLWALNNREAAAKIGERLRARAVESLSWKARIDELLNVYDRLLSG
ncbi:MAG: glycosyltransferase family 4 protein [Thermomicrobiaceae bacterium]